MDNVAADFTINENEPIQAEYTLEESEHFDCSFELFAAGAAWGLITGNLEEQTDLLAVLNTKANADSVNHDLNALEGEISDLSYTVNNNYSTITNRLENDELTISNNYTELSGYITSISNTIQSYGDIVTYNASSFATSAQGALANTAIQPNDNISRLTNNVGYITGVSWNEVTNKPSTFTPSYHEHVSSEITDLSTTIASAITNKADKATSLSGYGITDAYTKTEIDGMVSAGMHYKGTKSSVSQLPSSGNQVGDLWNVDDTGANYAWNGSSWDKLSENIDLSGYVPTSRTINGKSLSGNISLTASDVNALPSSTVIPTVNNGTLDIQVNGTSVGTFTANQSGNTTANIVVPDSATWGNITGDLTDQADLQVALDDKQDKLTAGTDLEIISAESARLPQGYTEVEYIQSDGDCYIDTGIISNGTDTIEQKFQKTGTLDTTCSWFGSMEGNTLLRFSIGSYYKSSVSKSIFMGGYNFSQQLGDMDTNAHIVKFYCIGNTYYDEFDGLLATYQPTNEGSNPTINSWLFARHGADGVNTIYDNEGTRIFYHKQKRFNGTVILDLVPARRNSDDELGFYNLANNTFLTNSGTGTLTAGADVVFPDATVINFTNESGYITGINSTDVTTALGYTPANDTLSNLGATSSKNFDGEWVIKNITIAASVTWDGSTTDATYSIANQLPNDNYTYEVLITGVATATGTAGRFMTIQLTTDVQTSSVYLCGARSSSTIQNQTVGSVLIRVGSARTITQYSTTAAAANGTYSLYLKGYRRIGTNT